MYAIFYSRQAGKAFLKLPDKKTKLRIKKTVDSLSKNPRRPGVIKLRTALITPYRMRTGHYRILFDIDGQKKGVFIYDIRKRDEKTYR